MTVRGKTAAASPGPEHHVLLIEELRKHLGIGPDALNALPQAIRADGLQPCKVILVGHDMHDDFDNMKKQGIELKGRLSYSGCIDTHAIIEDTGKDMSSGLSASMSRYGFAALHQSEPTHSDGKFVFDGAHNAGNDAVANVMVAIAQALAKSITTEQKRSSAVGDDLDDDWVNKPLIGLDTDVILLAYDTEKVESRYKPHIVNRITEHGFAWLRFSEIASIPPGDDYGTNWHTKIRAAHFINKNWKDYENKKFLCGNSKGFWPQYGKSQLYDPRDGPAPFYALFEKVVAGPTITDATASLRDISLKVSDPAAFPSLTATTPAAQKHANPHNRPVRGSLSNRSRSSTICDVTISSAPSLQGNPWTQGSPATRGGVKAGKIPATRGGVMAGGSSATRGGLPAARGRTSAGVFSWAQVASERK